MVTVRRRAYDLMYRFGAPWEGADRVELRALVADGRCAAETLRRPGGRAARAVDVGCGAGGVSLELAATRSWHIATSPLERRENTHA